MSKLTLSENLTEVANVALFFNKIKNGLVFFVGYDEKLISVTVAYYLTNRFLKSINVGYDDPIFIRDLQLKDCDIVIVESPDGEILYEK